MFQSQLLIALGYEFHQLDLKLVNIQCYKLGPLGDGAFNSDALHSSFLSGVSRSWWISRCPPTAEAVFLPMTLKILDSHRLSLHLLSLRSLKFLFLDTFWNVAVTN